MLLFFAGGSRKKSYEVSKFGGGGGGVYALNEFFEKFITFMNFFFLQHSGQHHTVRSVHRFFMRAKIWFKSTICPVARFYIIICTEISR